MIKTKEKPKVKKVKSSRVKKEDKTIIKSKDISPPFSSVKGEE